MKIDAIRSSYRLLLTLLVTLLCGLGVAPVVQPTMAADAQAPRVFVRAGWFTMGATFADLTYARRLCAVERLSSAIGVRSCASEELFAHETPARRVYTGSYLIDRFEVSRAEYTRCVQDGACSAPLFATEHPGLTRADHPASGMSWSQAAALCRYRGGRLPTEAEWERAARGDSARRFPWGAFYNPALANHGEPGFSLEASEGRPSRGEGYAFAAPVRAFEQAQSPHGAVQMAGNVWEWTADAYAPLSAQATHIDPLQQGDTGLRVVRGGSFRSPAFTLRVTHREGRAEREGLPDVGVRCVYQEHSRHTL